MESKVHLELLEEQAIKALKVKILNNFKLEIKQTEFDIKQISQVCKETSELQEALDSPDLQVQLVQLVRQAKEV